LYQITVLAVKRCIDQYMYIPGYQIFPYRDTERGGKWSFKNSGSRKILVEFHGSRSLVFYTKVSWSLNFGKAKGLEVTIHLFVFLK